MDLLEDLTLLIRILLSRTTLAKPCWQNGGTETQALPRTSFTSIDLSENARRPLIEEMMTSSLKSSLELSRKSLKERLPELLKVEVFFFFFFFFFFFVVFRY